MTNKSGDRGTRTETAIVRHAHANGFAGADEMTKAQRLRLNGAHDQGDIGLCPGVVVSSKGGHMAEQASDAQISAWLAEVETQRRNRGVDVAFLVTKRKGKGYGNAGAWWAHMTGWVFLFLAHEGDEPGEPGDDWQGCWAHLPSVRLTLADALTLLRAAGYGDRVEPECPLPPSERHGERRNPFPTRPSDPPDGSEGISGPREVSGVSGRRTKLAHRTSDGHWLLFDERRWVTGCMCGFIADDDDCGYGDSVLDHFEEVVRREGAP